MVLGKIKEKYEDVKDSYKKKQEQKQERNALDDKSKKRYKKGRL